jgi:peptide/nickel transport system ATP-binding protein
VALLEVKDLHVSFTTEDGIVKAVRGVTFQVDRGKTLGIVGESGSGKSVSTQTITGLTRGATISGEAWFDGTDLLTSPNSVLRAVRGAEIGMIFQDPLSSLHPAYRIGWQITEMIQAHEKSTSRRKARARAAELLNLVGIPHAADRLDDYPHQFSGGMRQRVMIAMAMALNPSLLIADEPTTALDVTVQAQVLSVMTRLQQEFDTAIVLITHDLGVIAETADDVVVMYAGTVMERASRRDIFYRHHNPYTEGLFASLPGRSGRERLTPIPGSPPSLIQLPQGCPFRTRCPYAFDKCVEAPPLTPVYDDPLHDSACWLSPDLSTRTEQRENLRASGVVA